MKNTLIAITLWAGAVPAFAIVGGPQSETLATWTFESSIPASSGLFAAEIGNGNASGFHASGAAVYSNPVGNGSVESFSSNNWSVGDYYQFQTSTASFAGISVSWDQTGSSTGPKDFKLQYSTNGTSWTDYMTYNVFLNGSPNAAWAASGSRNSTFSFSQDLSELSILDNRANVYFRLTDNSTVSLNNGTVATGGTDRVDNFSVSAIAIPEPSTYALFAGMLVLCGAVLRRRRIAA